MDIDLLLWRQVPEVGSSKKMRVGFMMSSLEMFVLFRSPPDIPLCFDIHNEHRRDEKSGLEAF